MLHTLLDRLVQASEEAWERHRCEVGDQAYVQFLGIAPRVNMSKTVHQHVATHPEQAASPCKI